MSRAVAGICVLLILQIIYGVLWYVISAVKTAGDEKKTGTGISLCLFMGFVTFLFLMTGLSIFGEKTGRTLNFLMKGMGLAAVLVLLLDVAGIVILLVKKLGIPQKRKMQSLPWLILLVLFGLQCYVYQYFVPDNGLASMKLVQEMLAGQLAGRSVLGNLGAILVQLCQGEVSVMVCFAVPVWLLFNFIVLLFVLANTLFETVDGKNDGIWFVDAVSLLALVGDYSARSPSNFLLHGLTTDRGMAYALLLPACFVMGCMIWCRKKVISAVWVWGITLIILCFISREVLAFYGLVTVAFLLCLIGKKVLNHA